MLRGYRLYIAAIGLALSCANHAYAEGGKQQSQPDQAISQSLQDIATSNRKHAERAERADQDEAPCGQGQYGSNSDLCAQWKAADAASDSAWWAWVAGISTIISTAAVLVAIGLTYQSNSIARASAKKQLRPYVYITRVKPRRPAEDTKQITIDIQNFGQTPATDVHICFGYMLHRPNENVWPVPTYEASLNRDIAPGHKQPVVLDIPEEWIAPILHGGFEIRIIIFLTFGGFGVGASRKRQRETLQSQIHYGAGGPASTIPESETGNLVLNPKPDEAT